MQETNRIEFKRELTRELDLEREVVAFLNYREGGNFIRMIVPYNWQMEDKESNGTGKNVLVNVPKDVPKELVERQNVILDLIKYNADITIAEMSQKTGVNERTIKRDIQYLQSIGLLNRIGTRKLGRWQVLKD